MNIELYEVVMQDVFDDAPKRSAGAELLQGGTVFSSKINLIK